METQPSLKPSLPPPPAESPPPEAQLRQEIPSLEGFLAERALARASALARQGHYSQAETALNGISDAQSRPDVLDLQARICAQQGRLAQAEALWQKVLTLKPGDPAAAEALAQIQKMQRPFLRRWSAGLASLGWLVAIAVLIAMLVFSARLTRLQRSLAEASAAINQFQAQPPPEVVVTVVAPPAEAVAPTPLLVPTPDLAGLEASLKAEFEENRKGQEALAQQLESGLAEIRAVQEELAARLPETTLPSPPAIPLNIPGLLTSADGSLLKIEFARGLFRYSWSLDPDGQRLLEALGAALQPHAAEIQLDIAGCQSSDEQEALFDLSLMRAVVAAQSLFTISGVPREQITLISAPAGACPVLGEAAADRQRAWTVILWIGQR